MDEAGRIYLRLLGRFAVAQDDTFLKEVRLSTRKVSALLAFLAMSPQQAATREQLAALLWGNSSDKQARQSLRQTILLLRKDLQPADIVDAGTDVIRLQPGRVWVDALDFDALSASSDFADLERAVGLVQGELMAGFALAEEPFEDWLRQRRRQFETAGTAAFESLAQQCDRIGKGAQAIATIERLLAFDPLREDWQRLALVLYARHRGQGEALVQAKAFTDLLQRELDVEPEPQTWALIQEIKQGAFAPPQAVVKVQSAVASVVTPEAAATPAPTEATREDAAPQPLAAPQPYAQAALARLQTLSATLWQLLPRRDIAAVAVTAASILLVGFAALMIGRSASPPAVAISAKPAPEAPPAPDPWRSPRQPATGKYLIPILVLPFKTYGEAAGSTQLVADMVLDDLISILSRVPFMRVIGRATSRSYAGQPIDVAAVGKELGVRYILDGSMRMHGGKLRVNVELINPVTRLSVWSGRIERDGADRHGVQDEIVGRLARELQFEVFVLEGELRAKDEDTAALVYRGFAAMGIGSRQSSVAAFKQAESYFRQALERHPDYVPAQIGLGAFHVNIGIQHLTGNSREHLLKAREIMQDVIRRYPMHSAAHYYLAASYIMGPNLQKTLDALERAIELDPSSAHSYAAFGDALAMSGRASEGLEHIRYAMRLSPREPGRYYWFQMECSATTELGRYQEAIESCRRSITLNPGFLRGWAGLTAAYALAGSMDEARASLDKLKALAPHVPEGQLAARFGRHPAYPTRIRDGLRLALNLPPT